jgi:hypothetical protein
MSTSAPCILVTVQGVTIDLGGFVLTGKGGGVGIAGAANFLSITNGVIRSFNVGINAIVDAVRLSEVTLAGDGTGAALRDNAQVADSKFLNNGADGLDVRINALITHCTFVGNGGVSGGDGLDAAGAGAVVTESVASNNIAKGPNFNGAGVLAGGNATLTGNAASGNAIGFADHVGGSTFVGNTGSSSTGDGFQTFGGASFSPGACVLIGNSAVGDGFGGFEDLGGSTFEANTADLNKADGFREGGSPVEAGSNLVYNTADSNDGYGFLADCPSGNYVGNIAEDNSIGGLFANPGGCNNQSNLGF